MDDSDDDSKYSPNPNGTNHQQGGDSANKSKLPVHVGNHYMDDDEVGKDEDELGEEEEDDDKEDDNGVQRIEYHAYYDDGNDDEDDQNVNDFKRPTRVVNFKKHPKKRKLNSLISNYEFAPRVAIQSASTIAVRKGSSSGRNPLTDWTEHETLVLLNAWGDRFVQNRRKSIRTEEWQEVADKVSEESKTQRTDTQCRNRVDTLKKKYKKEKLKLAETSTNSIVAAKWVFYDKMDALMSSSSPNAKVFLNLANGYGETRDIPLNSESTESEKYESDELPLKKEKLDEGSCYKLIANSIHKFGEIYEKIEIGKRQQMLEMEKMWMDFQTDLEMQLRRILENSFNEIANIFRGDDGGKSGFSTENING